MTFKGSERNNFYNSRGEMRFRSRGFFRREYQWNTSEEKSSRDEPIFSSRIVKVISMRSLTPFFFVILLDDLVKICLLLLHLLTDLHSNGFHHCIIDLRRLGLQFTQRTD